MTGGTTPPAIAIVEPVTLGCTPRSPAPQSDMMAYSLSGVYPDGSCQVLWEDSERLFC